MRFRLESAPPIDKRIEHRFGPNPQGPGIRHPLLLEFERVAVEHVVADILVVGQDAGDH